MQNTHLNHLGKLGLWGLALGVSAVCHAQLQGDVGVGAFATSTIVKGDKGSVMVLPYGYFDHGRFFMRVDTLGFKTMALGNGHLEVVGRISQEGFDSNATLPGVASRKNPLPVGLGTFQKMPWGGVFLNAFYNLQGQHGALLEATYAGKLELGRTTLYPIAGLEHRTAHYVQGLYGVSTAEAAALGTSAYSPKGSTVPVLGLSAAVPLTQDWSLNLQVRRRWLDDAIRNSPLVDKSAQSTGYVAAVYTFK